MNNYRLEPVAYAVFASNGNVRIWCADPTQVETLRQQYGEALQSLYAAPQLAPDVAALADALVAILEHDSPINIVDTATATERDIFDIAQAALAAYRQQKGDKNVR